MVSFTTVQQWEGGLSGFWDISLPSGLYYVNNREKMQPSHGLEKQILKNRVSDEVFVVKNMLLSHPFVIVA